MSEIDIDDGNINVSSTRKDVDIVSIDSWIDLGDLSVKAASSDIDEGVMGDVVNDVSLTLLSDPNDRLSSSLSLEVKKTVLVRLVGENKMFRISSSSMATESKESSQSSKTGMSSDSPHLSELETSSNCNRLA